MEDDYIHGSFRKSIWNTGRVGSEYPDCDHITVCHDLLDEDSRRHQHRKEIISGKLDALYLIPASEEVRVFLCHA